MDERTATSPLTVPGAPPLAGLTFRVSRGPVEYPHLVALRLAAAAWDQIDPVSPRERIPTDEELTRACAHAQHDAVALTAEVDGEMVGYNRINSWMEADGAAVYLHLG
jgi:hypothetical protein